MDIHTVKDKGQVIAHIFKASISTGDSGIRFLSPNDYTLQLGLIEYKSGHMIRTHQHNPDIHYKVDTTQEFLYLEKGKVKMTLYADDWRKLEEIILEKGDFLLLISGGHGFEIIEDCRLVEVKQGPYPGELNAKLYLDEIKK